MKDSVPPPSVDSAVDRLLSVDMEGWQALGAAIHVDLGRERTILVGKNASGKSLVMDGLDLGSLAATYSAKIAPLAPSKIAFDALLSGKRVSYICRWKDSNELDEEGIPIVVCEERCWQTESGFLLWEAKDGEVTFGEGTKMPLPLETGLLSLRQSSTIPRLEELPRLRRLLRGFRRISAGVPRTNAIRREIRLTKGIDIEPGKTPKRPNRLEWVAGRIANWADEESKGGEIDQLIDVCRRLRILSHDSTICLADTREEPHPNAPGKTVKSGYLMFGGVDFFLLSDGTLRAVEIVAHLIDVAAKVLLIDEPETAIHPGLLRRLLAEIDAHTVDRQVILATHSPLVVDWAQAADIRLVERVKGETSVRSLSDKEAAEIKAYLDDDLSMSDFVFAESSA